MAETTTVVIPYYNSSDTICRCISSVLYQVYPPFEIIIINDASNDWPKAQKIIDNLSDKRITVIHHKRNLNGSAARNSGIKISKGKFIAFLDSDDEWSKDHLLNCQSEYHKDVNDRVLFSKIKILSGPVSNVVDTILPTEGLKKHQDISEYLFVDEQVIQTSSIFISKEMAMRNLFDESLVRFQDYDFVLKLFHQGADFQFCNHTGVIVHWEADYISRAITKGASGEFAINYLRKNRSLFTQKAYTKFIVRKIFPLLIKEKKYGMMFHMLFKECYWPYIGIYDVFKIIAFLLLKNNPELWNRIKKLYRR